MTPLTIWIRQYHKAYIDAVSNPNDGHFTDHTPPITPDEFKKRLTDEAIGDLLFHAPPTSDQKAQIDAATVIYTYAYGDFIRLPLDGDAPVEVVLWQEQARKG